MIPAGLSPERLLVIVDFSWWLNLAFRVGGIEGMAPIVIGRFVELLRGDAPACLALAVDSVSETWRHELTAGLPDVQAYKGRREPKPREFYALSNRLLDIVRLHRVPFLAAEGWEADDAFAAAVPLARAAGLEVVMLSADKDLGQLVGPGVWLWDGDKRLRGPAEIEAEWGVRPDQLGDLLAIVGDTSDNVRGIEGLGPTKAAALLREFDDLENALAQIPVAPTEKQISDAEKARAKAKKSGDADELALAQAELDALREQRNLAGWLATLQAHADDVRLARRLVDLDANAPIEWDLAELPVGGYDVPAIRRAYASLGFKNLAAEVGACPKVPIDNFDATPAEGEEENRAHVDHQVEGRGVPVLHGARLGRGAEESGAVDAQAVGPRRDGSSTGDGGTSGSALRGAPRPEAVDGLDFTAPDDPGPAAARIAETARKAAEEADAERARRGTLCSYALCERDHAHVRELLAGIRTKNEAVRATIAIRRMEGIPELFREEHAAQAGAIFRRLDEAAA